MQQNKDVLRVKIVGEDAVLPRRGSEQAAGLDLFAPQSVTIPAWSSALVDLGVHIAIPSGHYGRIASRSSLAMAGIEAGAGTIDSDYRGPIKTLLRNHSPNEVVLQKGDRCAQLIISPIWTSSTVVRVEELDDTPRGHGGFGSTGK